MKKRTAAERRFFDNATIISACKLIFEKLFASGVPIYPLSELAKTTSGGTPSRGVSTYYDGDIPWIKSGELNDGLIRNAEEFITEEGLKNSSAKIYQKGTVVIALYGATVGKTGILDIDCTSNQAVCAVTPKNDKLTNNYLFWFFRYKREEFLQNSFGGAQPNISQTLLKKTLIPLPDKSIQFCISNFLQTVEKRKYDKNIDLPNLPPPLEEQRRIVGKIERLAEKIEEVRSLRLQTIKETEALLNSCYNEVFSYKKNWQQLKIKDFCHPTQYGYTESAVNEAIGPHFLRITDIQNGQVNWEKVPFCHCPNSEPYLLEKNDILFARTGGTTGKTFLIKDCPKSVFASYLIRLRVKDSVIPEYLYNYFQSPAYWKQIIDQKTGTGQPNVNGNKLSNLIVPIPPLSEQKRIVEYLDRLQSKIEIMKKEREKALEETEALLLSILDKAFKGEL